MTFFQRFWQYILQNIVAPTNPSSRQVWRLVVPFGRSPLIRAHAASVIIARVQLVCMVFAFLVPLCAIVDFMYFSLPDAIGLFVLRLCAGVIFAALAWPCKISIRRPYLQAMSMLSIMLLVPSLFYLAAVLVVNVHDLNETQHLLLQLYAFMPSIVLAGLAIFPLSALEILLFAFPILGVAIVGMLTSVDGFSLVQHGAALWFMCVMTGVAMFSGMTQSHYMEHLMGRAMMDPLTGAQTRRSGIESMERLLFLSKLSGKPLGLAFCDIDHFKEINDSFGHDAGDVALVEFVRHLRQQLRSQDVLIRWGGEEFILVFPDMNADGMVAFLERMRLSGMGLRPDGQPMTASVGMAGRLQDNTDNWQKLVDLADQRMYHAKHAGRACAVLPGDKMLPLKVAAATSNA